jgi:hypothetical protein
MNFGVRMSRAARKTSSPVWNHPSINSSTAGMKTLLINKTAKENVLLHKFLKLFA